LNPWPRSAIVGGGLRSAIVGGGLRSAIVGGAGRATLQIIGLYFPSRPWPALGHVWTAPWQELSDVSAALVGSGRVPCLTTATFPRIARLLWRQSGQDAAWGSFEDSTTLMWAFDVQPDGTAANKRAFATLQIFRLIKQVAQTALRSIATIASTSAPWWALRYSTPRAGTSEPSPFPANPLTSPPPGSTNRRFTSRRWTAFTASKCFPRDRTASASERPRHDKFEALEASRDRGTTRRSTSH